MLPLSPNFEHRPVDPWQSGFQSFRRHRPVRDDHIAPHQSWPLKTSTNDPAGPHGDEHVSHQLARRKRPRATLVMEPSGHFPPEQIYQRQSAEHSFEEWRGRPETSPFVGRHYIANHDAADPPPSASFDDLDTPAAPIPSSPFSSHEDYEPLPFAAGNDSFRRSPHMPLDPQFHPYLGRMFSSEEDAGVNRSLFSPGTDDDGPLDLDVFSSKEVDIDKKDEVLLPQLESAAPPPAPPVILKPMPRKQIKSRFKHYKSWGVLGTWGVREIKQTLRALKLSTSGNKNKLLDRLREAMAKSAHQERLRLELEKKSKRRT